MEDDREVQSGAGPRTGEEEERKELGQENVWRNEETTA